MPLQLSNLVAEDYLSPSVKRNSASLEHLFYLGLLFLQSINGRLAFLASLRCCLEVLLNFEQLLLPLHEFLLLRLILLYLP